MPHSICSVEEIVFAVEVTDVKAFTDGVGELDGLAAGSGVAATSVGTGRVFATLFDKCSLRRDISGVEIGVTTVGANDDERFWVLWESVFHFVEQMARKRVVGLWCCRGWCFGGWCCGGWCFGELRNDV